jgi:PAS domain S-box-containing protein
MLMLVAVNSYWLLFHFWVTLIQNCIGLIIIALGVWCLRLARQGHARRAARIYLAGTTTLVATVVTFLGQPAIPYAALLLLLLVLLATYLDNPAHGLRWGGVATGLYLLALALRVVIPALEFTYSADDAVGLFLIPSILLMAAAMLGRYSANYVFAALAESESWRLELEQSNQALRESQEWFQSIFEQAAVGITQVAPDGRFLRVNQRFCDMVGYSEKELLERGFQDITHPDDLEAEKQRLRLAVSDNGVGFPEKVDFRQTETLGLKLVNTLVDQLHGKLELVSGEGTQFSIAFENPEQGRGKA